MEVQKTDRQTDKTTRWAFTAYKDQWSLFDSIPDLVASWGWQTEVCPDTQREHYQGYILLKRQARFSQLKQLFPGVHIEVARNWAALIEYCKKIDSAVPGTQVTQTNTYTHLTMTQALLKLAAHVPYRVPLTEDEMLADNYEKKLKSRLELEYNQALHQILKEDDRLVSIYANNAMRMAWNLTREHYLEKAQLNAQWYSDEFEERVENALRIKNVPAFEN